MRVCRFQRGDQIEAGLYGDEQVIPLAEAAQAYEQATQEKLGLPASSDLLDYLPAGEAAAAANKLAAWVAADDARVPAASKLAHNDVKLLVPIPRPNKLFLLAGNYAAHIEEGGGHAAERRETFPYVFLKPASTTLTNPGDPVQIPKVSPDHIDWELELAIVIGKRCKHVKEADALKVVAGYTVVNDISNRKYRPNPDRKERKNNGFFDWLHGKWFDSFCPCGPCIASADAIGDPQKLDMKLSVNGDVKQDASTALQIFPVAAVIEFISQSVTLEPGDIISTGTPAGVGNTTQTYLQPGDRIEAWIEKIGALKSPVESEV